MTVRRFRKPRCTAMRIDVLTLFPEMFDSVLSASIMGRAAEKGLIDIRTHNIRDYSANKHKTTDDYPFGGGAGMVMMCQPVFDCMAAVTQGESVHRIYMSPRGRTLTSKRAQELSKLDRLVVLCGHYEGIDERIMTIIDEEISIGDYVLTGGEIPAMALIDCVSRFIDGVLGSSESALDESFSNGLLEYPQYTRPADYNGMKIPEILLSGHHANIEKWRRQQALLTTARTRPELLERLALTRDDKLFLEEKNI